MNYIDELIRSIADSDVYSFDEIFDSLRKDDIETELSDIARLCEILTNRTPEWMFPHQFVKIEKMIVMLVEKHGYEIGSDILLEQLNTMFQKQPEHAIEIINLFVPQFKNEDKMNEFVTAYNKVDDNLKIKIKEVYYETKKINIRVEIINQILNKIDNVKW